MPPQFRVRTLGSGAAMLKVDEGAGMQRAQAIGTGWQVGLHGALLAQRPQELALAGPPTRDDFVPRKDARPSQ